MHMADALLTPAVAVTMYAASGVTAGVCISKLKKDNNAVKIPTMAVAAAMVFAGQMVNYSIPGTGSSGHICGGILLSAMLGPYAGFVSMVVILTIQCLFFADGGLMALGANCWNMAFYGCFVGYFLLWRPIIKSRMFGKREAKKAVRAKIILAAVSGCVTALQLGSLSVVIETSLSGITELPFGAFLAVMQPIHLAIALVEGMVTAAVLVFVADSRPELLQDVGCEDNAMQGRYSYKTTIAIIAISAVVIGGGLSLLASSDPDGLEWSLFGNVEKGYGANMNLDEDEYGVSGNVAEMAAAVQEATAVLPEYSFGDNKGASGTAVSGLVGSVMVAGTAVLICLVGRFSRRRKQKT